MMSAYLELGLLKRNPFETIDTAGVGQLIHDAVQRGRKTKPELKLGICGEHGGDPESIEFFYRAGLDYVSLLPLPGADRPTGSRPGCDKQPARAAPGGR